MLVTIVDVGVEIAVMSRAARHPSSTVGARVAGVSKVEGSRKTQVARRSAAVSARYLFAICDRQSSFTRTSFDSFSDFFPLCPTLYTL